MNDTTYTKLEQLLLAKSYTNLDTKELQWVNTFLTEEAYTLRREILLQSTGVVLPNLPTNKARRESLRQLHQQHYPASFSKLNRQYFTGWQVVLIAILTGIGVYFWFPQRETVVQKQVPQVQYRTDTLWQEKVIYEPKIIYKERIVKTPIQIDTVFIEQQSIPSLDSLFMKEGSKKQQQDIPMPPKSKSMKDRNDLWNLMANT